MKTGCLLWFCCLAAVWADRADLGSEELERYFNNRVTQLEGQLAGALAATRDVEVLRAEQVEQRSLLLDMLGLKPDRERTPLQATVTGTIERDEFTVEMLHFQSSPGLYVTANFYLPKKRVGKVPAILYVCGHGSSKKEGVSFGNKVSYQHHGIWFARNGYACLVIDTLQMGEIEGIHHGTYRYDRWWWHARGYTSAGVEAWNCIRALDYLQSREEVDGERLGVTGRSGGGAYSWWIAAIDERIKAAVPVAGIASLRNHVVDGCVEGHCDCMYHFNTYRWDFEQVAALVAPRPLLISNTDKDSIFPLDGVYQVYRPVRRLYELHKASGNLGLNIEEGPHKDTQPLRTSAFHWMNRHLKGTTRTDTFEMAAVKLFEPKELKVFDQLPADQINTRIDEVFVPKAPPPGIPRDSESWNQQKVAWKSKLRKLSFAGWPARKLAPAVNLRDGGSGDGMRRRIMVYQPEPDVTCAVHLVHLKGAELREIKRVKLRVVDGATHEQWAQDPGRPRDANHAIANLQPRGIGDTGWEALKDKKKNIQIRRRFALIGQTLDGMRVHDILGGIRMLRGLLHPEVVIVVEAHGLMAGNVLYAALFLDRPLDSLVLFDLPSSHREGPYFLNVLKVMDLPQAVAMAAERSAVTIHGEKSPWEFPRKIAERFDWPPNQLLFKNAQSK